MESIKRNNNLDVTIINFLIAKAKFDRCDVPSEQAREAIVKDRWTDMAMHNSHTNPYFKK